MHIKLLTTGGLLLPLLTALASHFAAHNLMLVIFFTLACLTFAALLKPPAAISEDLYLILTAAVSLSLLLSYILVSGNLSGFDAHQEFNIFLQVLTAGAWSTKTEHIYNSALSISILPAVISVVTGLDGVQIFKFIFPILFAMVPLVLYKIFRAILGPQGAFLSVFLFMAYQSFYEELPSVGRQEIAELLLVLLLWILISTDLTQKLAGKILVWTLIFGVFVAHYSIAYFYIILLLFSALIPRVYHRSTTLPNFKTLIIPLVIALPFYYFIASGAALTRVTSLSLNLATGFLREFVRPTLSTPGILLQALGLSGVTPGVLHDVNRLTQSAVQLALLLGFIYFARKNPTSTSQRRLIPLMSAAFAFLIAAVFLPSLAGALNLTRIYHITLLLISPCLVFGAQMLGSGLRRVYASLNRGRTRIRVPLPTTRFLLAAMLLFSYFLFVSGWVWAVSADQPISISLDWQRMRNSSDPNLVASYFNDITVTQDIEAARWMKSYLPSGGAFCADHTSTVHVLASYGEFSPGDVQELPNECDYEHSYIFLSTMNAVYGVGTRSSRDIRWPLSKISGELGLKNRIYSGDAVLYS